MQSNTAGLAHPPGSPRPEPQVADQAPQVDDLLRDARNGLRQTPRSLPCKYLYDERGSRLFERITEVREYYPTRTELAILNRYVHEMAEAIGPRPWLVEFGSGSGLKTEKLLSALEAPAGCVLVDISLSALTASVRSLGARFAQLPIQAVCADYTRDFELPRPPSAAGRVTGYFPGSTLGNFAPGAALSFLRGVRKVVGAGGSLLIGIDRVKDVHVLEAAYNDSEGVTASFNLNLLQRLKRAGAQVDLDGFRHRAVYNREAQRVEMHLVSLSDQTLEVSGEQFAMREGETICTEHSHKYRLDDFQHLAAQAGFRLDNHWSDPKDWFSVCHLLAA